MKRIVLLHTVQCMYLTFEQRVRQAIQEDVRIDTLLDTFFASDSNERKEFTQTNLNRLYLTLKSAEMTGADLIAVICSTLSPHVKRIAPFLSTPVLTIDERLGVEAIRRGERIMVLASAPSAVGPTEQIIREAAKEAGRAVRIESRYEIEAFHAMMRGDLDTHDQKIIAMAREIRDQDVIVFAQGSMEQAAPGVERVSGLPVVTAPALCIEAIRSFVEGNSLIPKEEGHGIRR
jgi:aspartate/glutamate racemase